MNWFPWLQEKLEAKGWNVWVPDLPHAEKPNIQRYNQVLLEGSWIQNSEETILIGHSSGSVAILGLLESLPENKKVKACYLVGAFKNDLEWDALSDLFLKPFDFSKIKKKAD